MVNDLMSLDAQRVMSLPDGQDDGIVYYNSVQNQLDVVSPVTKDLVWTITTTPKIDEAYSYMSSAKENTMESLDSAGEAMHFMNMTEEEIEEAKKKLSFAEECMTDDGGVALNKVANAKEVITKAHEKATKIEEGLPEVDSLATSVTELKSKVTVICEEIAAAKKDIVNVPDYVTNLKNYYVQNDNAFANAYNYFKNADDYNLLSYFATARERVTKAYTNLKPDDAYVALVDLRSAITDTDNFVTLALKDLESTPTTLKTLEDYTSKSLETLTNAGNQFSSANKYIQKEALADIKSVESKFSSAKAEAVTAKENAFTDEELNEVTTAMKDLCNSVESTDSSMMYADKYITDVPPLANQTKDSNLSSLKTLEYTVKDLESAESFVQEDLVWRAFSDAEYSITDAKKDLITLEDTIYTDDELNDVLDSITDKPLVDALTELNKADKYITSIPDDASDDLKRYYLGMVLDKIITAESYFEESSFITNAKNSITNLRNKTATIDLTDVFSVTDKNNVLSAGDYMEELCTSITKVAEYTTEYGVTSKTYATKTREALEWALTHLTTAQHYVESGSATAMSSITNASNVVTSAITKAEAYEEIDVTEAYTAVTVAIANASDVCEAIEKAYVAVQQVTTYSKSSRTYAEKILTILEATLKRVEIIESVFYSSSSTSTTLLEYIEKAETTTRTTLDYIETLSETTFKAEELETIKKYVTTLRSDITSAQELILELCSDDTEDVGELEEDSLGLVDALKQLLEYITTVASNLLYVEKNIKKPSESITNAKNYSMTAHDKSVKASQNTFEEKELVTIIDLMDTAKDSVTDATEAIDDAEEHLDKAQSYSNSCTEQLSNTKSLMSLSSDDLDDADDCFQEDAGITYYSITSVPPDNGLQEINLCATADDLTTEEGYVKTVYFIPNAKLNLSSLTDKLDSQKTVEEQSFSSVTSSVTSTYSSFSSAQTYTEQSYHSITNAKEQLSTSKEQTDVTVDFSQSAVEDISFAEEVVEDEETVHKITNAKDTAETTKEKATETITDVGDTETVTEETGEIYELILKICAELDDIQYSITSLPEYSGTGSWGTGETSTEAAHKYLTSMTEALNTTLTQIVTVKTYIIELVAILKEKLVSLKQAITVCTKKTQIVYASIVTESEVTTTVTTVETAREYVLTMCDGLSNAKKALEKAQESAKKASEAASSGLKDLMSASESIKKADSTLRNESGAPLYDFKLSKAAVDELATTVKNTLTPAYTYEDLTNTMLSVSKAETAVLYAKNNSYTITRESDKHEYHMLIDENGDYNIIENNAAKLLRKYYPQRNVITDPDGNVVWKLSEEEPGPGSDDLSFLSSYTYRQLVGLTDELADVCTSINKVQIPSFADAPPNDGNGALQFKNRDFDYYVLRNDKYYHLFKNGVYTLTYELKKDSSGQYIFNEQKWVKINGTWQSGTSTESKYSLSRVNRSDGKLSYWKLTRRGDSTPLAALTPPMRLTETYEDCEERLQKLYGKNNNKTSTIANAQGTTFSNTSVVDNTAKVTTTTEVATTTKTTVQQSKTNTWSWSTASTTLASMSKSNSTDSLKSLIMSDTTPTTTWSWAKDVSISKYLSGSGTNASKSSDSSAVDTVVEKGKQALGAVSNLLDKIVAFFTKDEETAAGENLKKEEPLTVPDTSKETKALAGAMSGMPPMSQNGIREGVIYSQSLERQKVSYGKGRQAYQAEHRKSSTVRKRRARYKNKKMLNSICNGSGRSTELNSIMNSSSEPVVDFSTT